MHIDYAVSSVSFNLGRPSAVFILPDHDILKSPCQFCRMSHHFLALRFTSGILGRNMKEMVLYHIKNIMLVGPIMKASQEPAKFFYCYYFSFVMIGNSWGDTLRLCTFSMNIQ